MGAGVEMGREMLWLIFSSSSGRDGRVSVYDMVGRAPARPWSMDRSGPVTDQPYFFCLLKVSLCMLRSSAGWVLWCVPALLSG